MTQKIAILFANLKGNVGDFAILDGVIGLVRERYPGHRIDVWPHGFLPVDGIRLAAFRAASTVPFSIVGKTSALRRAKLIRNAIRFGTGAQVQNWLQRGAVRRYRKTAQQFEPYDRIFVVGGDQFDDVAAAPMFGTLEAIARHNPRISTFPVSINPRTLNASTATQFRDWMGFLEAPIIVRDAATQEFIRGLGLQSTLGSDAAIFLAPQIRAIVPDQTLSDAILFSVTSEFKSGLDALTPILRELVSQGQEVILHTTCEPADRRLMTAIAERLDLPFLAPLTWQEAVAQIKASKVTVTNRFHALLLGSMASANLLPLGNRQKTRAFSLESGVPFHAMGFSDLTAPLIERSLSEKKRQTEATDTYVEAALRRPIAPFERLNTG